MRADRDRRKPGRRPAGRARGVREAPTARSRGARLILLAVAVGAGFLTLAARCAHLQILRRSDLQELARLQQEKAITLDPRRGPILDRNGKELAVSLDVDSVFADPGALGDRARAARRLAAALDLRAAELRERLDTDRRFVWLKRKIAPDLRRGIEALGLPGVGFVRESRRYYPKQTLAAHILGACGIDNQGLAGLEFMFNDAVKGTPGRMLFLRDGHGGPVLDRVRTEAIPGIGLVLTVDEVIQHIAERELDAVMTETSARGAAVVVLRPQTGEVLALASRPGFDPNQYSSTSAEARSNRAVSDFYEPGSTFKVVTAAAALDAGRAHPQETIWCENGSIVVARHRFNEDRLPFGNLTFTEVLAKSSNVGAIKVAQRLKPREFLDAIRRFGFGRKTGLDLPGESPGLLRDLPEWSGLSQASIAMGQEIGVTPLQLAAAIGAVANDGLWMRPYLVEATIAPDGRRLPARTDGQATSRPAIAASTARTLRRMLQWATIEGTGRAAAVPGYSVGGKTGTAQKVDQTGRYSRGKHVPWFAGFVPADRPALVIVVMVDEPKGPRFHGGDVVAPVFARIALPTLQYLGVAPDRDGLLVFNRPEEIDTGALRAVSRRLSGAAGGRTRGADRVVEASLVAVGGEMPDLVGMSLRQASERIADAGLTCTTLGSGPRVTQQSPGAGGPLPPAGRCTLVY